MSLKNKKSKFLRILDVAGLAVAFNFCIVYPKWLIEGYLNSWYLKIAVGIAVYGGFIAALVWVIKDVKRRGW
jgi:hypothetical protein